MATTSTDTIAIALVLPPVPSSTAPISSAINFWSPSIRAAYARLPNIPPSLLYIGVFPPFAVSSRRASFVAAQKLLTALYALAYNLDVQHAVDVRIVFLDEHDAAFGPIMSVEQLADLQEWDQLLVSRNDLGYQLQGQFLAATGSPSMRINYVEPGAFAMSGVEDAEEAIEERGEREHSVVAVGGTFDHLHLGHKLLLTCTAYMCAPETPTTRLIVGLTGPEMLKTKKHAEHMESWKLRAECTLEFIRGVVDVTPYDCRKPISTSEDEEGTVIATFSEWRDGEVPKKLLVQINVLSDPFGPTITEEDVTALVVTKETESGGAAVNKKREEKGWSPLEVGVVDLLMDGGEKLSSTELRRRVGEAVTTS